MTDSRNLLRIEPQPWMVDPATLAVLEALAAAARRRGLSAAPSATRCSAG